jgi:phosphate acetyltransferase
MNTAPPAVYLCPTAHCPQLGHLARGLLAELASRYGTVGVFRPIVADASGDAVLAAVAPAGIGTTQPAWGATADELLHDSAAAMAQVVARYADSAARSDAMLVLGSEYDCSLAPVEFAWNTRIAANLDVPMALVVLSAGGAAETVRRAAVAIDEATRNYARVVAVLAPRATGQALETTELSAIPVPAFVVDEAAGTATDLAAAATTLDAEVLAGAAQLAGRSVGDLLVGDTSLAELLPAVRPTSTVLFPADRSDLALGLLVGGASTKFALPAAAIATGPSALSDEVRTLWRGLAGEVPLLHTARSLSQAGAALAGRPPASAPDTADRESARRSLARQVDLDALLSTSRAIGRDDVVTPLMFEHRLLERARKADRHIVLPEGTEERILRAAHRLLDQRICRLTLLGDPATIRARASELGLNLDAAQLINPATSELRETFAVRYSELRAKKGVTLAQARQRVADVSYFGTMMVLEGLADGMVSGSVNTTAHTIRPALEVIRTRPDVSVVSSVFLMCLADRVLVFGDCAVNPNPTPDQLADIAISSAETARQFGITPRVAMLSYSTGASGTGPDVEQTIEATRILRERAPELPVDGPLQYDAAVEPSVARTKLPDSPVAGRATVLIFPDLQTGNNTYKAVQRSAGALAIGPVLQGLNKPVNDLSRGALVSDIVNTVAITAIQAG